MTVRSETGLLATRETYADVPDDGAAGRPADVLGDPALAEALQRAAVGGRLSDEDVRAMRRRRRRGTITATATALAVVAVSGVALRLHRLNAAEPVRIAHIQTGRGEFRSVLLADGTRLRLNGATRLDVRFERDVRRVELAAGEVHFDVAHDAARPFEVRAGRSATQVLGTAFDLDIEHSAVRLSVYRGRVRFGPATSRRDGVGTVLVPAGWRSGFTGDAAIAPTRFDAAQQDWRSGWIDTDAMRLEDVVGALNRGGGPLVEPPPPGLARIALSGRFKLDRPEHLLSAIGVAYGFRVERHGDGLEIVADRPATE